MHRILDVIGPLSLATDVGNGQPLETALRCALLASGLASAHGVGRDDVSASFWGGLLRFAGCSATSLEEASFGGDDLDFRRVMLGVDFGDQDDLVARLERELGHDRTDAERHEQRADFFARAPTLGPVAMAAHCEVAVRLASRLDMAQSVLDALAAYHERWDGAGPKGLRGEAIPVSARLLSVAHTVLFATPLGGKELRTVLEKRAGTQLDPAVVSTFLRHAAELLPEVTAANVWERARAREPLPHRLTKPERLLDLARVLADYVNIKSPYTLGHAQGVARLAVQAGKSAKLDPVTLSSLELAALLHDLGRISVPNGIWDCKGPLGAVQLQRVRDHVLYTERILSFSAIFSGVAELASSDHERIDGGGYHRRLGRGQLQMGSRLLAAADVFHALLEQRAHREAYSTSAAERVLEAEVRAGRLDASAVRFVLDAAGQASAVRGTWPAGLSDREVDVLRLVTRGLTNKEIASLLDISARTVQQHTINIYAKLGVSTRAAAALFASEHDLLLPR